MLLRFFNFLMRWFQRLVVIAALIALGAWLFYIGREHQIFLDNRAIGDFKALDQVNVSVNNGETVELMPRERDVKKIVGPEFSIKAEIFDENGEVTGTINRDIKLKFLSRDIMISLPALAGNSEDFILTAPR